MSRHLDMYRFERPDVCVPCGGACCKSVPGSASPEDFGAPDREAMRQRLTAAFDSGRWALDWYEGDPVDCPAAYDRERTRAYYVRPARVGHTYELFDPAWPGTACTFLGKGGCELTHDERPLECRALEPVAGDKQCTSHAGSKRERAIEWIRYERVLAEVVAARGESL